MSSESPKAKLLGPILELCRKILETQPNSVQVMNVLESLLGSEESFDIQEARERVAETFELAFQRNSCWKSLARALEIRLGLHADRENRRSIFHRLHNLYENQLHEPALSFGALARAFHENPQDEQLHQELETIATKHQMLEELVGVYLDVVERNQGSALALRLSKEVANTFEHKLGNLEESLKLWEQLLRANPQDTEVDANIKRLYRQTGRNTELATLYRSSFGVPQDVENNLEQLLASSATRGSAAQMLEPYYRRIGDFARLAKVLEVLVQEEKRPEKRLTIFKELIQLYEVELDQKQLAFIMACRAFRENMDDKGIRQQLERLAQQTGSFEELQMLYEDLLEKAFFVGEGEALLRAQARLTTSLPGEQEKAIGLWKQVLGDNPKDGEALLALEQLLRLTKDYPELIKVLRQKAWTMQDVERKKDLYFEIASLLEERLGKADEAIQAYLSVLAFDPKDQTAMNLVQRLMNGSRSTAAPSRTADVSPLLLAVKKQLPA